MQPLINFLPLTLVKICIFFRRPTTCLQRVEAKTDKISLIHGPTHVRRSSLPLTPYFAEYIQTQMLNLSPEKEKNQKVKENLVTAVDAETNKTDEPKPSGSSTTRSSMRKNHRCKRKNSTTKKKDSRRPSKISLEGIPPPSYEMVILQKSSDSDRSIRFSFLKNDNNYRPRTMSFRRGFHARNSAIIRVRTARERFQKLAKGEPVVMNEIFESKDTPSLAIQCLPKDSKRKPGGTITKGIVKKKRLELFNTLPRECICSGACSCATYKKKNILPEDSSSEVVIPGLVRSKIQFYKTFEIDSVHTLYCSLQNLEPKSFNTYQQDDDGDKIVKKSSIKHADDDEQQKINQTKAILKANNVSHSYSTFQRQDVFKYFDLPFDVKANINLKVASTPNSNKNYVTFLHSDENDILKTESENQEIQAKNRTNNNPKLICDNIDSYSEDKVADYYSSKLVDKSHEEDVQQSGLYEIEGPQDELISKVLISSKPKNLLFKKPSDYGDSPMIAPSNSDEWNENDSIETCETKDIPYHTLHNETLNLDIQEPSEPTTSEAVVSPGHQNNQEDQQPKPSSGAVPKRYSALPYSFKPKKDKKNKAEFDCQHSLKSISTNFDLGNKEKLLKTDETFSKIASNSKDNSKLIVRESDLTPISQLNLTLSSTVEEKVKEENSINKSNQQSLS